MRLKYEFETMDLLGKTIAVPVGDNAGEYHEAIRMNDTANMIFRLLKEETTEAEIVDAMEKEYEVDREILANDVAGYIHEFREKGLLSE